MTHEEFSQCRNILPLNIENVEYPYIDWNHYEWGNQGELEELKVNVSLDMDSSTVSTTAGFYDKDGNTRSVPESMLSKAMTIIESFRNSIVDEIRKRGIVVEVSSHIGEC